MNTMRKAMAFVLAAALVLSLTGCGMLIRESDPVKEREKLISILNDISANMHPATAGSSLTAARLAADLIGWAATTSMDKKEAAGIVMDWLKEQTPEIRDAFREKINSVSSAFEQIVRDGAAGLLESAGVEKDLSNLGTRLKDLVSEILASGGLD